jgi:enoyl-CoA hydratase/carnithine racemase
VFGFPPARDLGALPNNMWLNVGPQWAKRLTLTGDTITGAEAAAIGLVLKAVPADLLEAEVEGLVDRMAQIDADLLRQQAHHQPRPRAHGRAHAAAAPGRERCARPPRRQRASSAARSWSAASKPCCRSATRNSATAAPACTAPRPATPRSRLIDPPPDPKTR